ncbi:MAG: hypothetical protein OEL55_02335, partial [Desulfobulbaceae bacterium]|nr:hypothetical protein [Desulfobulbaceae bacterium]
MKKSVEAALLSALVFPGSGHLYLKKYFSGLLLLSVSLVGLWFPIRAAIAMANQIADQILSGNIAPDIMAITELVTKQSAALQTSTVSNATYVFVICWLIGIA